MVRRMVTGSSCTFSELQFETARVAGQGPIKPKEGFWTPWLWLFGFAICFQLSLTSRLAVFRTVDKA
eukprot:2525134-Amphidinium_carterae.1